MHNLVRAIVPVIIGVGLWAAPVPAGLDRGAWIYFALFVAVVATLVLEPIPPAVTGLVGITLAIVFRLVPISPGKVPTPADAITWGLSGFSDGTVWLIFSAFMFALGYGHSLLAWGAPFDGMLRHSGHSESKADPMATD